MKGVKKLSKFERGVLISQSYHLYIHVKINAIDKIMNNHSRIELHFAKNIPKNDSATH